jgi:hypothetical protein
MSHDVTSLGRIDEGETCQIGGNADAILTDETGTAVPAASLTAFTVTVYDVATGTVIVNARNVLNANGGTVTSGGLWSIRLEAADNALLNQARATEVHRVYLEWTWSGGTRKGRQEYDLTVDNLTKVT